MKIPLWKRIVAVVAGIVAGGLLVGFLQGAGQSLFPPPPEVLNPPEGKTMMEMVKIAMDEGRIPTAAIVLVLVSWLAGTAVGSGMGTWIGGWGPGLIAGGVFAFFSGVNLVMIPHPAWFMAAAAAGLPIATIGGIKLAGGFGRKA